MSKERRLNNTDIARTPEDMRDYREDDMRGFREDDMRGHREESMVNRPDVDVFEPSPATTSSFPRRGPEAGRYPEAPGRPQKTDGRTALFADHDAADMRNRWSDIQAAFIDEPRRAVEQADSLVADVMKRMVEGFANERGSLERHWDRGDKVTTEDLRVALTRYRSFFDRLLSL
jgi:hypothetical protein